MPFIGNKPSAVPLTSADIADGIITSAKIVDATIANADIANSTIDLTAKVTGTLPTTKGGTGLAALGTVGQALVVNSGATALEFATVGATAGQVIQVVGATDTTVRTTTSNTFVTASNTLTASITPSASANKILILVSASTNVFNDTSFLTVYRGATNLGSSNGIVGIQADTGESPASFMYLDSPSTTSSTTYQVYMRTTGSGTGTIKLNGSFTPASTGSIILMEIKG